MSSILIIIVLLFAGKPSSHAWLACDGVDTYGSDDGSASHAPMPSDSGGRVVIELPGPEVLRCHAWTKDYRLEWMGDISVHRGDKYVYVEMGGDE